MAELIIAIAVWCGGAVNPARGGNGFGLVTNSGEQRTSFQVRVCRQILMECLAAPGLGDGLVYKTSCFRKAQYE